MFRGKVRKLSDLGECYEVLQRVQVPVVGGAEGGGRVRPGAGPARLQQPGQGEAELEAGVPVAGVVHTTPRVLCKLELFNEPFRVPELGLY